VSIGPVVEYNSTIWSPSSVGDIESVERVQQRFTKRLPGLKNLSYDQRLKFLDVPSLELSVMLIQFVLVITRRSTKILGEKHVTRNYH